MAVCSFQSSGALGLGDLTLIFIEPLGVRGSLPHPSGGVIFWECVFLESFAFPLSTFVVFLPVDLCAHVAAAVPWLAAELQWPPSTGLLGGRDVVVPGPHERLPPATSPPWASGSACRSYVLVLLLDPVRRRAAPSSQAPSMPRWRFSASWLWLLAALFAPAVEDKQARGDAPRASLLASLRRRLLLRADGLHRELVRQSAGSGRVVIQTAAALAYPFSCRRRFRPAIPIVSSSTAQCETVDAPSALSVSGSPWHRAS